MFRVPLIALTLLLAACGGDGAAQPVATALPIATEISAELLAPLEGLGPCGEQPEALHDGDVPGLYLPEGARVTALSENGPITQIEGWVELTPIGVRADYVTRDDVEPLRVEDEVWESESLVTDGEYRLFVKAQGICRTESVFVAVISPEDGSPP